MNSRIGTPSQVSPHPLPSPAGGRGGVIVALRATPVSHKSGGFTLLEMLMAIVLLGLLLAGAYSGIQTSVRAMHAGERLIERIDRVRTVQEFLRHQLTRILPISYAQTDAKAYVFEGERDFMRFVAPMPGYLSHGGPYVQTLALV